MLLELEKSMGIMPGCDHLRPGRRDGVELTRTFINKYYDEFAAACPEEVVRKTPLTISRGRRNVLTPMGSNTR